VPRHRGGPAHRETAQTRPRRSPGAGRLCPDGALNLHRDHLPAGTIGPIRGQGLPFRTGSGNAPRFPRPRGTVPRGPAGPGVTEASARPGGREAPARGGAGAGRGALWAPRRDKGRRGAEAEATAFARVTGHPREHPFGRKQETHRVSPARAGRCPGDRQVLEGQRPAPDPAGAKRPPWAGRALAGGLWPPAGQGSAQRCGRGDSPCQDAHGARRQRCFPLCAQAASATGAPSAASQCALTGARSF